MKIRLLASVVVACLVLLALGAAGYAGAVAALGVVVAATCYGAWRFVAAFRLTGSRLGLAAAVVSLGWCVVAVGTFATGSGYLVQAGAAGSIGVVAAAGFGLSRSRHWARLAIGLWLPAAVEAWRRGDVAPLEQLLDAICGEAVSSHAARSAALAHTLAESLTLTDKEVADVVLAALVHPLGAAISRDGARSWGVPSGAAIRATELLDRIPPAAGAAAVLRHFDERWDGKGPGRLAGEQVPMGSRMLAAIDLFDSASERGLEPALASVRQGSGTAFDPVVASELIHFFRMNPKLAVA